MTNADITQNAVVVAPRPALIRGYLVLLNLLTIGLTAAIYLTISLSLPAYADDQSPPQLTQSSNQTLSPIWDRSENTAAKQNDVWFDNYRFRDGETAQRLRIHYVTLGTPHRNAHGDIDNAVLVLHWTGADSSTLLGPAYMHALFDPGRPLDAGRYFLVFPDNVGDCGAFIFLFSCVLTSELSLLSAHPQSTMTASMVTKRSTSVKCQASVVSPSASSR